MDVDRILNFTAEFGKNLLISGAEIYRVEDTVDRISVGLGLEKVDIFASPTAVIVSTYSKGRAISVVRRISKRSTDLHVMGKLNSLSREIVSKNLSIEESEERLDEIMRPDNYSSKSIVLASAVVGACFCIIFGGGVIDTVCAFFVGILSQLLLNWLSKKNLNRYFIDMSASALISVLAVMLLNIGVISTMEYLVAGAIMILVPGLPLVLAIRDLLDGQLLAGMARLSEVVFIGIAIASGFVFVAQITMKLGGII